MKRSRLPMILTIVCLLFFYLPILILVVNSFNASRFSTVWEGFSFKWYVQLFNDRKIWHALRNTGTVALGSTLLSMVLGTMAALGLHRYRSVLQRFHYGLVYLPLVVPDILMGLSLLLFFVMLSVPLGLMTITLAHVTFCISYVAMVVLARLQDFDFQVIEAAEDLGAGKWMVLWKVLLPLLAPGILAGGLLAFTLSIDDFVISFFVAGPGSTTLPIQIYSMIKHGNPPVINALSTLLLCLTFLFVWISQHLKEKKP